jgi:hypothetical protein
MIWRAPVLIRLLVHSIHPWMSMVSMEQGTRRGHGTHFTTWPARSGRLEPLSLPEARGPRMGGGVSILPDRLTSLVSGNWERPRLLLEIIRTALRASYAQACHNIH